MVGLKRRCFHVVLKQTELHVCICMRLCAVLCDTFSLLSSLKRWNRRQTTEPVCKRNSALWILSSLACYASWLTPLRVKRMKTCDGNTSVMDMFEKGKVLKICAPMVRYSKLAFRTLVRKYNCDICFTPMIVASDFMRSVKARDSEFTTNEHDRPLIVQFAAHDAQTLADAACVVAPFSDGVDLNCGCPQRWAMSAGYGACLINKPELVKDMVRHVRNQVDNPNYTASIKIRIHKDLKRTVDLCQKAESAGVSWITVHGRTSEERHQPVHYDAIKTIKDSVSVPVIANGDIKYLRDVESTHQLTGVDGVMAARGLLANPAMFTGYEDTPLECIWDWVDISIEQGTPFTCFHHHLIYMLERVSSQPERKVFNSLSSTSAVIDYLQNTYGSVHDVGT